MEKSNKSQSNLFVKENNESNILNNDMRSKSKLQSIIMKNALERNNENSNSFRKRRFDTTSFQSCISSSNKGELEQKKRKIYMNGEYVLNKYKKVNESIIVSVPYANAQSPHHKNGTLSRFAVTTKADEIVIAENSILIGRLRDLCRIQGHNNLKRDRSNLHTKASVERENLIHRKRIQLVKLLHDARVKNIIESIHSYKCELVNDIIQRHQQNVVAEVNIELVFNNPIIINV